MEKLPSLRSILPHGGNTSLNLFQCYTPSLVKTCLVPSIIGWIGFFQSRFIFSEFSLSPW
jgi:hypothetical protein